MAHDESDDSGPDLTLIADFTFDCPFCKDSTIIVGDTSPDGERIILHTLPMCQVFTENADIALFLEKAKKRIRESDQRFS